MVSNVQKFESGAGISLVMPCYNEEGIVGYTIAKLIRAFEKAGYNLQVVAVDNGSRDRTGEIIRELAEKYTAIVCVRVESNQGYGFGILSGMPYCTSPWVGIIPADGQVDAEDVVRLYEAAVAAEGDVIAKARRVFRMDGLRRRVVTTLYNVFVRVLWPNLGSIDINGSPKILPRRVVSAMKLESKDWFLDPEIMIKGHALGLRVIEFNVFARMRGAGISHVRPGTCWEFFHNLLVYRFGRKWKRELVGDRRPVERDAPEAVKSFTRS
jgi:glycosyltransferase involved in cell wall biosynthesis